MDIQAVRNFSVGDTDSQKELQKAVNKREDQKKDLLKSQEKKRELEDLMNPVDKSILGGKSHALGEAIAQSIIAMAVVG